MSVQRRNRQLQQLSLKMEAIDLINKGKPLAKIAETYGVDLSTVRKWKKHQYKIQRYCSTLHMANGRRWKIFQRTPSANTLDGALYIWYKEALDRGERITGKVLQQKAKEINLKLTGVDNFKASVGWLTRWKKRHGIVGKFAKNLDERATVSLPAVEDGEDPLKLVRQEVILEDGSKKIIVRGLTDPKDYPVLIPELREVPFLSIGDTPYSPCLLEYRNVEEILIKSTPKDKSLNSPEEKCSANESKYGTVKDESEVNFPQPVVEDVGEEDNCFPIIRNISPAQQATHFSSHVQNKLSVDDDPNVVRASRSEHPDQLHRNISSTQSATSPFSDVNCSSVDVDSHIVIIVTESPSELPAPLDRSVSSTQRGKPHFSAVVKRRSVSDDPPVVAASRSEQPDQLYRNISSTQRAPLHGLIVVPQSQPKPATSEVYEIVDSSDEEEVNAVEQRDITADYDLVYVISDDSDE